MDNAISLLSDAAELLTDGSICSFSFSAKGMLSYKYSKRTAGVYHEGFLFENWV